MMRKSTLTRAYSAARFGILLGLAGGIAEILWIAIYGKLAGVNAANVASAVSAAIAPALPGISLAAAPVLSGIATHLLLATGLGIALAFIWISATEHRPRQFNEYAYMVSALIVVWSVNFLVILPLISPTFVDLVPYPASFASKVLFGLSGAAVLRTRTTCRLIPVRASMNWSTRKDRQS